jgi:putative ABC transport system permease protein
MSLTRSINLILHFAFRDLRGGIRGFGIFIACIAIGVAAITTVAAVSRGLTDSLAREGRVILGADAAFVTLQREATPDERQWLDAQGKVTPVAYLRAMVRAADGNSVLVEGKSVDSAWPMHGKAVLAPDLPITDLLAERDGVFGNSRAVSALVRACYFRKRDCARQACCNPAASCAGATVSRSPVQRRRARFSPCSPKPRRNSPRQAGRCAAA